MKTNNWIVLLGIVIALTACGGGGPTKLGEFPAITKTEGDAPFTLTAPSSPSPGEFTYTSSNPEVATISDDEVTIVAAGTTTITATQEEKATYSAASVSTVLTVNPKPCIAPATRESGVCKAPQVTGNYVTFGSRVWMPVSFSVTWTNANAFCTTTIINGQSGWRLPTELELIDLYASGAMNNQGWALSRTWSSTEVAVTEGAATSSKAVRLNNGDVSEELKTASAYVACVR